jgi:L-threonylcarbamoyladenylate synthase
MTLVSPDTLISGARAGQLVSFPTDTVPALAARSDRAELIFTAKQRSPDKPLILMGASLEDLMPYVLGSAVELEAWRALARRYWPGALTLVLPASVAVPPAMNPLDPSTIGLRVPDCAIAREILAQTGPLATTSANLSGQPPLQRLAEIDRAFDGVLTLDPEAIGPLPPASGLPSTVAKWIGDRWEILRQGSVNLQLPT